MGHGVKALVRQAVALKASPRRARSFAVPCSHAVLLQTPLRRPAHVLAYLGRYTHRVPLSNERLVALEPREVRFRWRDYADGSRVKLMTLTADEFLRRFLLHVVPDGFVRIRHFGLPANRTRVAKLARGRALLDRPSPPPAEPPSRPAPSYSA